MSEVINHQDIEHASLMIGAMRAEMTRAIVMDDERKDIIVDAVASNGHMLFEGPPSVGKTHTSKVIADIIDGEHLRIQGRPSLLAPEITGFEIWNPDKKDFEFRKGSIDADVVLADEINRTPAKIQAAYLEAMDEKQVSVGRHTYPLRANHLMIATQNPEEIAEGTNELPKAELDRFMIGLTLSKLSVEDLITISYLDHKTQQQITVPELVQIQNVVKGIPVSAEVRKRMAEIAVGVSELDGYVDARASALDGYRPMNSFMKLARANALRRGKAEVSLSDVHFVAPYVLSHRISLTDAQVQKGRTTVEPVHHVLAKYPKPYQG